MKKNFLKLTIISDKGGKIWKRDEIIITWVIIWVDQVVNYNPKSYKHSGNLKEIKLFIH
jgi:hypothetical protein